MHPAANYLLPLTFEQIAQLMQQLPAPERLRLAQLLTDDAPTDEWPSHLASEAVLAKDWLTEAEDQAWQHL
jgi:hypothetical protein